MNSRQRSDHMCVRVFIFIHRPAVAALLGKSLGIRYGILYCIIVEMRA
jgi:hypothetical protein